MAAEFIKQLQVSPNYIDVLKWLQIEYFGFFQPFMGSFPNKRLPDLCFDTWNDWSTT